MKRNKIVLAVSYSESDRIKLEILKHYFYFREIEFHILDNSFLLSTIWNIKRKIRKFTDNKDNDTNISLLVIGSASSLLEKLDLDLSFKYVLQIFPLGDCSPSVNAGRNIIMKDYGKSYPTYNGITEYNMCDILEEPTKQSVWNNKTPQLCKMISGLV